MPELRRQGTCDEAILLAAAAYAEAPADVWGHRIDGRDCGAIEPTGATLNYSVCGRGYHAPREDPWRELCGRCHEAARAERGAAAHGNVRA